MTKQLFRVLDMHCSNCVMTIEGLEDDLPGVKSVRASYHKGTVEVEYDERRLSEGAIKDAIARLGYTVA
ncbi:MAG: heavy-metal-associated domain-containing protein [Anaerolineae bacterium]|jgi:copper chaperone CopZ|nr:heavy-metal-associated domain-containing protein [Anaerolineae bacterium]